MGRFDEFYEDIWELGVVPVVVLDRVEDAVPLAQALVAGGLPAAEVTFRTPVAQDCIRAMHEAHPRMMLGAGTVLTCEDVDRTVMAGGEFVVSPGFDAEIVQYCLELDVPVLPAAVTPTEIMAVRRMGLDVSKFFPAGAFGGLATINDLAAPFVGHRFVPTGGVSQANLAEYLASPHVVACGGSWMVRRELIAAGDFARVQQLSEQAAATVRAVRG